MPNRPSKNTTNLLWATSDGTCSNPSCLNSVLHFDHTSEILEKLGEVAHIKGNNPGSNRYDENQPDSERHHFDNLIILCPNCHTTQPDGIDIPNNEARFPIELLYEWKSKQIESIKQRNDRNWICNPNSALLFQNGTSTKVKFWVDREGNPRLYTPEQLAIVEHLFHLNLSFSQLSSLLAQIESTKGAPIDPSHQTMNDAAIGSLFRDLQHLPKVGGYGWIGYLSETLLMAQDITLGELHLMLVEDGLAKREQLRQQGLEKLRDKAAEVDPEPCVTIINDK